MRKIILMIPAFMLILSAAAQKDLTGAYGYTLPSQKTQIQKDKSAVPGGLLILIRMDGNKYRFWLDVLTGPPGYNRGETDGTIHIVNDTASFDNTYEDAEHPCILRFRISGSTITVNSESTSFNCGFGNGVSADGTFTWLQAQPLLDNKWLRKEYPSTPMVTTAAKAELFQDENCLVPFAPRQFFPKGESLLSIAETSKSIYTEQIPSPGKLIWGWIRKSDLATE